MISFVTFFYSAGPLVWGILLVSVLMWLLILRTYWRQYQLYPDLKRSAQKLRQHQLAVTPWQQIQLASAWLNQASQQLDQGMAWIRVFILILPFLGLLGTVDGMIESFTQLERLNVQQQLSGGISRALLTTLAGLVTSLSGLYLAHNLNRRNQGLLVRLRTQLTES